MKLEKEIKELHTRLSCKACKIPLEAFEELNRKIEEYDQLILEYKQKEAAAKTLYEKRKREVFADVNKKIADAIRQFSKEKGYAGIFDSSKLEFGVITHPESLDVTKEFIEYYNENYAKAQ